MKNLRSHDFINKAIRGQVEYHQLKRTLRLFGEHGCKLKVIDDKLRVVDEYNDKCVSSKTGFPHNERGVLYIEIHKDKKDDNRKGEIIFSKDGEHFEYGLNTIKGMICFEILNGTNEPMSTKELKDKAKEIYAINSRHGKSKRAISDAKRGINYDLKEKLGIINDAMVKVQGNKLKFDDNLYKNAILEIA